MGEWQLKILLIYDHFESRNWVFGLLSQSDLGTFQLDCMQPYQLNVPASVVTPPDVCVIESSIEKATLFTRIRAAGVCAPIIVLTTESGFEVLDALHHGAADCLIKKNLVAANLEESICAVIDQARTADSRAEHERLYLSLVENTTDLIFTHDLDGRITSINKAGEEDLGYQSEDILKMNFQQLIAPEYVDLFQLTMGAMLESRKSMHVELVLITRNGQPLLVSLNYHLVYQDGAPTGVQAIGQLVASGLPLPGLALERRLAQQ
jgi:PAS domain S-box-containing protein